MTDTENLVERLREAAKRADYFQTGEQKLLNLAAQAIARLSAHTPTDGERSLEQQEEQRHGDRSADHEEQQTDDLAATGTLRVGGHAKSMSQAPSDGKRVISLTPTDDEREALLSAIINAPESGDALHVAEAERVRDAILAAGFRRSEVPEPSAEEWAARVQAAREKAIAKGYTPEHDAKHGVRHLLRWAIDYARRGKAEDSSGLVAAAIDLADVAYAELERLRHVADTMKAVSEALRTRYASDSQAAYFMRQIDTALEALPEPQGDLSDAQAERARIVADLREWSRPLGNSPEEETLRLVIARIERAAGGVR